jgi:hypothetical protein
MLERAGRREEESGLGGVRCAGGYVAENALGCEDRGVAARY